MLARPHKFSTETARALRSFRDGETECVAPSRPIAFFWILIEINHHRSTTLPPKTVREGNPESWSIRVCSERRRDRRQGLSRHNATGSRPSDLGASDPPLLDLTSPRSRLTTPHRVPTETFPRNSPRCTLKLFDTWRNYPRKCNTPPATSMGSSPEELWGVFSPSRIIAFSEAGFEDRRDSHSIEGTSVVLGRVVSRDGIARPWSLTWSPLCENPSIAPKFHRC